MRLELVLGLEDKTRGYIYSIGRGERPVTSQVDALSPRTLRIRKYCKTSASRLESVRAQSSTSTAPRVPSASQSGVRVALRRVTSSRLSRP